MLPSAGIWRREVHIWTSVLRNISLPSSGLKISRARTGMASHLLHAGFLLGWFSTLKMEMLHSSETSVHIQSTQHHIPADGNFHNYHYENLISYICVWSLTDKNNKLCRLSSRSNRTNRVTAACRRSYCQLFWIESATWLAWLIPLAVISFSWPKLLLFFFK
jgi:hypothetical protein